MQCAMIFKTHNIVQRCEVLLFIKKKLSDNILFLKKKLNLQRMMLQ